MTVEALLAVGKGVPTRSRRWRPMPWRGSRSGSMRCRPRCRSSTNSSLPGTCRRVAVPCLPDGVPACRARGVARRSGVRGRSRSAGVAQSPLGLLLPAGPPPHGAVRGRGRRFGFRKRFCDSRFPATEGCFLFFSLEFSFFILLQIDRSGRRMALEAAIVSSDFKTLELCIGHLNWLRNSRMRRGPRRRGGVDRLCGSLGGAL